LETPTDALARQTNPPTHLWLGVFAASVHHRRVPYRDVHAEHFPARHLALKTQPI